MKKDEKVILESILKDCGCAKEIITSCLQIKEKYGEQEILPVLQQERYRLLQKFMENNKNLIFWIM